MKKLILATRSSPLALWQAQHVASLLQKSGIASELLPVETSGDRKLEVSLSKIGEKGLFTQELENLLLEGKADLAVHSAKDMPSRLPSGLEIIAFSERENPSDVLVSFHPELQLSTCTGLRIGTSSTRRIAMLSRYFPGVQAVSVRGNLQTRFRKMQENACDGMLLARAGVVRMGLQEYIREELPAAVFTPAAGQASLAIESATHLPEEIRNAIRQAVNHPRTEMAITCERAFLRELEGGCSIPVFALCQPEEDLSFLIQGGIISLDGSEEVRKSIKINLSDGISLSRLEDSGRILAADVLQSGGAAILQRIRTGQQ